VVTVGWRGGSGGDASDGRRGEEVDEEGERGNGVERQGEDLLREALMERRGDAHGS
jgi:hypothetical protein